MAFFNEHPIPQTLLSKENGIDDINILIGENGSGKSTMLNNIAKYYLGKRGYKVIAIANTIHDKFNARSKDFEVLRASSGKSTVKKTIKAALKLLATDDLKRNNNIALALTYVKFDPVIGLQLKGVNKNFTKILDDSNLDAKRKEDLAYTLNSFLRATDYSESIQRINLHHQDFYDFRDSYQINILLFEKELKELKIVKVIDVFLCRNREMLPVNNASSGELTVISSILYITSSITSKCVILVDEPENSLHPKWQTEYVKFLTDLFYRYEPKIVIATHSPLIINAAENTSPGVKVFKGSKGRFSGQDTDTQNVEEIYQDYFDVTTPENRYLSQNIVDQMNQLAEGRMPLEQFEKNIHDFKRTSYSDKQKDVLDGIIEMGRKIIERQ
ncbi:MAG: AAA family ATPase [Janthinobacterium sp.]|jgi:predicted ATPase